MKKCNFFWIFFPLLMVAGWSCHNDEPTEPAKLYLLESDSIALCHISESFKTDATGYPHPWTVSDRASWKSSIELDTVIDEESGKAFLTVGALTLYIPGPEDPMNGWLKELRNVRDFKLYASPGATFRPRCIPIGCDSITVDKIDYSVDGYIHVPDHIWDTADYMITCNKWGFHKETVHWLDTRLINTMIYYSVILDDSHNQLDGEVDVIYGQLHHRANLSYNKFTKMMGGWDFWMYSGYTVPDLQYNLIEIPEEILDTDFWRENHERFIGNPGYQAPK